MVPVSRHTLYSSRLLFLAPRPALRAMPRGLPGAPLGRTEDATAPAAAVAAQRFSRGHVRAPPTGCRSAVFSTAATSNGAQASVSAGNGNGASPVDRGYQLPPPEIVEIIDAPPEPLLSFSPDRTKVLQLVRPPPMPPVAELARDELKLAGLRIDAEQMARSRMSYYTSLALVSMADDTIIPAPPEQQLPISGIAPGHWINFVTWSHDGATLAFTLRSAGGPDDPPRAPLQLWVADTTTGRARRLLGPEYGLNSVVNDYEWIDSDTIVAAVVPQGMPAPPSAPPVPLGPVIQDNAGGPAAQARTYQDLLKNEHDEALFEHYTTAELVSVKISTGEVMRIGEPRMYAGMSASPDGRYIVAAWLERPFSFNVPCGRFPKRLQLWDRDGKFVREIAYLPLAEDIPVAFNSCRKGPRSIGWRDDKPAELYWAEAQDEGDPAIDVSPRDLVFTLPADEVASSSAAPRQLAATNLRYGGISWGDDDLALIYESWWKTRRSIVCTFAPARPDDGLKVLFDRNYEDAYTDPGSPAKRRTPQGTYVLAQLADETDSGRRRLLMQGSGASNEGNKPFIDLLDADSGETQRIWQSKPPFYESTGSLLSDLEPGPIRLDGMRMLMTRENPRDPPQYFVITFGADPAAPPAERRLSNFPHPYPSIRDHQKEIVRYKRDDGVDLTATLYTPPGYDCARDGPLPCLLWAYPREFKSKDAAGQLRQSPHQFSGIGQTSPLLWLARGVAILDGASMPILAEGDEEPNDTFREQLVASAKAAVEEVVSRGVADPTRIGVGGHSYGAFMAANLLAHCGDLFACGIARSGAYNRTLTPFGFQAEERTLWQAPETYALMSPFNQADKIKKPLLLIHGEADNNTGTFPMQSERFYAALKGHGAPCRLVILPHESHGYRARESILHTLHEMDIWLAKYVGCSGESPTKMPVNGSKEPDAEPVSAAKL